MMNDSKFSIALKPGEVTPFAQELLEQLKVVHENLKSLTEALLPVVHKDNRPELKVKFDRFTFACEELHNVIAAVAAAIDETARQSP